MNVWELLVLGKHLERGAVVEVVDELAVSSNTWELPLPELSQASLGHVFVAADKPNKLRGRGEAITQNRLNEAQVAFTDDAPTGKSGRANFERVAISVTGKEPGAVRGLFGAT